jgi:hypothetical protein
MARLGARLLIGDGLAADPDEGSALLRAAGELGEPAALDQLATMAGAGAWRPQDWPAALDYLQAAAERGGERARAQLLLLSPDKPLAKAVHAGEHGPNGWGRLKNLISLESWRTPPAREALLERPRVRRACGLAPPEVCDWIREKGQGRLGRAMMYRASSMTAQIDASRNCSDYQFDILNTDVVVLLVRERIAALTRLPVAAMEPPRIFHYALGEDIKPHYDTLRIEGAGYERGGYEGDRVATLILYLNDDFEGGELDFPKAGFRDKGRKGDALYFAHVDTTGRPDRLSLHGGLPITRGEKWVFSQWIHDRPFVA